MKESFVKKIIVNAASLFRRKRKVNHIMHVQRDYNYYNDIEYLENEDYSLKYEDIVSFLSKSFLLRSVHNVIRSSANVLHIEIKVNDKTDYILSKNIDAYIADMLADFVLLGATKLFDNFSYCHFSQNVYDFIVYNYNCASYSAKKLFEKILYLEHADKTLTMRLGSDIFIVPRGEAPFAPVDIENLRDEVAKMRKQSLGTLAVLPHAVDFANVNVDYTKYAIEENFKRTVRSIANLYTIPLEILDNSTASYNNRRQAAIAFYQNFIIPTAFAFLDSLKAAYLQYCIENDIQYVKSIDYSINYNIIELKEQEIASKIKELEYLAALKKLEVLDEVEFKKLVEKQINLL